MAKRLTHQQSLNKKLIEICLTEVSSEKLMQKASDLLSAGADPNAVYEGDNNLFQKTPALLLASIWNQSEELLNMLISSGADIEARDPDGETALFAVARNSIDRLGQYFIKAGANVNVRDNHGMTPLMEAASNDDDALVNLFISNGADIDAVDSAGCSALTFACCYRSFGPSKHDAFYALLRAGANPNGCGTVEDKLPANRPLDEAARYNPELIEPLLEAGADINAKHGAGLTAVMRALESRNSESFNILMGHNAYLDFNCESVQKCLNSKEPGDAFFKKVIAITIAKQNTVKSADSKLSETNDFEWEY